MASARRRSPYGRRRALALGLVYLAMAAHVIHWKVSGRTLAPLELNEVMYTFELGIVTAGFLFMALAVLATAVLGRFFCSWLCHIIALQDLCAALLRRLRIPAPPLRSRLLRLVPILAALYMFVWPQVLRLAGGRPLPRLRLATDADGWASFLTTDFTRNLPGPAVTIATFLVCGFVIVYLLGSRAFCHYACPYGAVFRAADRIAPGRIRVNDACVQCGLCTAVCTSGVRVHDEVRNFGMVVDARCVKDLDCVGACPEGALRFGFGKPALVKGAPSDRLPPHTYEFSLLGEAVLAALFLATFLALRGLYDVLPFLLSLGAAGIIAVLVLRAAASLSALRSPRAPGPRRWNRAAVLQVATAALLLLVVAHGLFWQYHRRLGLSALERAATLRGRDADEAIASARAHLDLACRSGLLPARSVQLALAAIAERDGDPSRAAALVRDCLVRHENDAALQEEWGRLLIRQGDLDGARSALDAALRLDPRRSSASDRLAVVLATLGTRAADSGRLPEAADLLRRAVALAPSDAGVHESLGVLLARTSDLEGARASFSQAVHLDPRSSTAHFNLGLVLLQLGDSDSGLSSLAEAARLDPACRARLADLPPASRPR